MKKRWLAILLTAVCIASCLSACGKKEQEPAAAAEPETAPAETEGGEEADTSAEAGEPVTLIWSNAAATTEWWSQAQKEFKAKVEELSGGNIQVECYDSGTLYNQDDEVAALINGDIDICLPNAFYLTDGSPWISMFGAGYIFNSYEHMDAVMNGEIGQEVFQRVADEQGILPLMCWYQGARCVSLSFDKQLNTPEDLKGVNLRMPDTSAFMFLGKALGASPTPVNYADLYTALDTGVVDGQDNPLPSLINAKFYEVQKSVTITNHYIGNCWPTINLDKWNSLTEQQQAWIMEAIEYAGEFNDNGVLQGEQEAADFLKEAGLKVYEADIDAFAETVLDYYLNDADYTKDWDMELFEEVRGMAQ